MNHLGLIGGIGVAATEFYYRSLAAAHSANGLVMDLTITHADSTQLINNLMADARDKQADLFADHIARLRAAGAQCVALTSMAGHFCIGELIHRSDLPIVNAIEALTSDLRLRGLRRIGLLGTRSVLESRLYGQLSEFEVITPREQALDTAHGTYVAMALAAQATEDQRQALFAIGRDLSENQGAEAVVLGGTDLFLAFNGHDCGFPVIDSAKIHIDALMQAVTHDLACESKSSSHGGQGTLVGARL